MKSCVIVRGTGAVACVGSTLVWSILALTFISCSVGHYPTADRSKRLTEAPDIQQDLKRTVYQLAGKIGERNAFHPVPFKAAKDWILAEMRSRGLRNVSALGFDVDCSKYECKTQTFYNLEGEVRGTKYPDEIVIIGAHYDTKVHTPHWKQHDRPQPCLEGTPGANDNASGVAAMLSLAKHFAAHPQERTLRFVAFTNEEAPFYQKPDAMGSMVYARFCKEKRPHENLVLMITPETLGCYSKKSGDDHKKRGTFGPLADMLGLKDTTDYVAFTGNMRSNRLMREFAEEFQKHSRMDVRTLAVRELSKGIAWSDDWSFWQFDVPAFAVTDTAYNRYDSYHDLRDRPETLDYPEFAEVTRSLRYAVAHAATKQARE
jgi:hypothetical protein